MVLTDVVMPNLNGFELGNRIAEIDPAQKVLYMSGLPRYAALGQGAGPPAPVPA